MEQPTFTIQVRYDALTKISEIEKVCDRFDIEFKKNEKFMFFTTDDPRNFFMLGYNHPDRTLIEK